MDNLRDDLHEGLLVVDEQHCISIIHEPIKVEFDNYKTRSSGYFAIGQPRWKPIKVWASIPMTQMGLIIPDCTNMKYKRDVKIKWENGDEWSLLGCWIVEVYGEEDYNGINANYCSVLVFDRAVLEPSE